MLNEKVEELRAKLYEF
jgi:methylthioribose-1-phosphate isomerase